MSAPLKLVVNGQNRSFPEMQPGATLAALVEGLGLKPDRIALELNGDIAPRSHWAAAQVNDGDRIEIVHFVGGGI